MERAAIGYTLIEVMIVLAITTILFFSAVTVFSSQRGSTDFSQSMQDLNSRVQSYANSVQTSSYPGSEDYSCAVQSDHAILSNGNSSGTQCIFLGLTMLAYPAQDNLQSYTILGNRDVWKSGDTGNPATSIDGSSGANPEPAILSSGSNTSYVLTDTYKLGAGATIKSSKVSGSDYSLIGMYNGLPSDKLANSQGTGALVLLAYPCTSSCGTSTPSTDPLKSCIEEVGICAGKVIRTNLWSLCVQDNGGSNTALLTAASAPGGITTHLNFGGC